MKPIAGFFLLSLAVQCLGAVDAVAQQTLAKTNSGAELKFVAIVSRHGVRSPTSDSSQLNIYSRQAWPQWSVPAGYLTAHGYTLMKLFGSYDRELFVSQGLLSPSGCSDAEHIRIAADSDQRTRETAKALAEGLAPGCKIDVSAEDEGTSDPIFHGVSAGAVKIDKALALAAIGGRIGGNPQGIVEAYRPQLLVLQDVLNSCASGADCSKTESQSILTTPTVLGPGKNERSVELRTPLNVASTMAENFLLEYAEGMDSAKVGWGQVDLEKLRELIQLHTAQEDLVNRVPYIARSLSTNLLSTILRSLEQAAADKAVEGAITKPDDRILILVGHDTNLANIAGALNLNWLIDGRRDDTPPGGALVFELWKNSSGYEVRTWFMTQTLDQMRTSAILSLAHPPERVPVFIPACGAANGACTLDSFRKALRSTIESSTAH